MKSGFKRTINWNKYQSKIQQKINNQKHHIWKITTGQGNDYKSGCLLDYNYFKRHYSMIGIDLSKLKALDYDLKTMQQINFTENLSSNNNKVMFFIIEEAKETILDFSQGTVKNYCKFIKFICFNII